MNYLFSSYYFTALLAHIRGGGMCCSLLLFLAIGSGQVLGQIACSESKGFLEVETTVYKLDDGVYRVHVEPNMPESCIPIQNQLPPQLLMSFSFFQNNTFVAKKSLLNTNLAQNQAPEAIDFLGSKNQVFGGPNNGYGYGNYLKWFTSNGEHDYIISFNNVACDLPNVQVNQINKVKVSYLIIPGNPTISVVSTLIFKDMSETINGITTVFRDIAGNVISPQTDQGINTPFEFTADPISMNRVNSLKLLTDNGKSAFNQYVLADLLSIPTRYRRNSYVVPYGGCPPYSQAWQEVAGAPLSANSDGIFRPNVRLTYDIFVTDNMQTRQIASLLPVGIENITASIIPNESCKLNLVVDYEPFVNSVTNSSATPSITFPSPIDPSSNLLVQVAAPNQVINQTLTETTYGTPIINNAVLKLPQTLFSSLNTTMNSSSTLNNNVTSSSIIVPAGVITTIQNANLQFLNYEAGIVVQPGGKLIIDNSTLNACPAANHWQGIRAIGNNLPNMPTTFNPSTQTSNDHGIVVIRTNSEVQNAQIGLMNARNTTDNGYGIVVCQNAKFTNTDIGVYLCNIGSGTFVDEFGNTLILPNENKFCQVVNATFTNNIDLFNNLLGRPVNMVLAKARYKKDFTGNTFVDNISNLADKGVGIFANNARVRLQNNQFTSLFKGIDYASLPSLSGFIEIANCNFERTHRAITLTGGFLSDIHHNQINSLGFIAPSNANPSYGLFIDGTMGATVRANTFGSATNTPTSYDDFLTYGMIVRNTGSNNFETTIKNNNFTGGFATANSFSGDNNNMVIDCNTYSNQTLWDWAIDNSSSLLENQGICQQDQPMLARRNYFHTITNPATFPPPYHIISGMNTTFEYRAQTEANKPSVNNGLVSALFCFDVDPGSQCAVDNPPPPVDPNQQRLAIATTTDSRKKLSLYTELYKSLSATDALETSKIDLQAEDRDAAKKVLAATYFDEGNDSKSLEYLQQLSLDNSENIAFYDLFQQLLGNEGGRLAKQNLLPIARQQNHLGAVYAQAIVGEQQGILFDKEVPMPFRQTQFQQTANTINGILNIVPNPSNGQVQINSSLQSSVCSIRVTDLAGRVVYYKNGVSSDTISLPESGMYICQLLQNNTVIATQKVVIVP